jgi:outer membrane receptor protein involved in Fe transport
MSHIRKRFPWRGLLLQVALFSLIATTAAAGQVSGTVRDETGGALPGVLVELLRDGVASVTTTTDARGSFRLETADPGPARLIFSLVNFAPGRRQILVPSTGTVVVDAILHLSLSADVVVTGTRTFTNLADAPNPAENLVGVAQAASQGAITARQLETRPIMRSGEVLETVPGVIISQHSGEGKANQYYLRGFNLDHGTDFATTVAGMPVNMPTHGHGYSDLNFLIPELVSGVQYSKGPYYADQGDFATAGAANINYTNSLDRPIVNVGGGDEGWGRVLGAASRAAGNGTVLGGLEVMHNDGPWTTGDDYRRVNGVIRFSRGDNRNGFSVTGLGYRATWDSTDQIPLRAVETGLIPRFGSLDATDGGDTYRYSGSVDWQRTRGNATTRLTGYGIGYDLNLYSNFTYFLDDPVQGDQFHQADHRFVSGLRLSHRRLQRRAGFTMQNTFGVQLRNDDISKVGLYHTAARQQLSTVREDGVLQTSAGLFAQNETEWRPWLRTLAGLRVDGYRFNVDSNDPLNSGTDRQGIASPKGGIVVGPFAGTELYANAGMGFHSNDARGATITRDPLTGKHADRVTPLVRAKGAEVGVRTVTVPHLQSSLSLWSLRLDSELIFVGDAGTTEAGRPSHRYGVEFANYYSPLPWLIFDGDLSLSKARFVDFDPAGQFVPEAVNTVVSGGASVDNFHKTFGSLRLRYFGPRALVQDDSVRSKATTLLNFEGGYQFVKTLRANVQVYNLLDARVSDIDYYFASRLPGEPIGGVDDIHVHPAVPRTLRVSFIVGF